MYMYVHVDSSDIIYNYYIISQSESVNPNKLCNFVTVSPTVVHGSDTSTHSSIVIPHNPQSGVTSVSIANGKRTKPRTSITPQQLDILKQAYLREQRPTKQTREDLMAKTGLDMKVSL